MCEMLTASAFVSHRMRHRPTDGTFVFEYARFGTSLKRAPKAAFQTLPSSIRIRVCCAHFSIGKKQILLPSFLFFFFFSIDDLASHQRLEEEQQSREHVETLPGDSFVSLSLSTPSPTRLDSEKSSAGRRKKKNKSAQFRSHKKEKKKKKNSSSSSSSSSSFVRSSEEEDISYRRGEGKERSNPIPTKNFEPSFNSTRSD